MTTKTKTEFEAGYINGFYGALRGVLFGIDNPGASLKGVRKGIVETIDEMRAEGDLDVLTGTADLLVDVVEKARDSGNEEEMLKFLDELFQKD